MKLSILVLALCIGYAASHNKPSYEDAFVRVDIDNLGIKRLDSIKSVVTAWWIEVGTEMLVRTSRDSLDQLKPLSASVNILNHKAEKAETHLIVLFHTHNNTWNSIWNLDVLIYRHGFAVVQPRDMKTEHNILETVENSRIFLEDKNLVLAKLDLNDEPASPYMTGFVSSPNAQSIKTLVSEVNQNAWFQAVSQLATYNRFTRGTGIAAAQTWLVNQFRALPGFSVATQLFQVSGTNAYNIIAKLDGTERPNDIVIVGAHYDSTSQLTGTAAPGAEDNGSGSAAVLEMARIMSKYPPPATVLFILFSGEEQGLIGSKFHAASLSASEKSRIKLVHTMDMIAYKLERNANRVLIETSKTYESWFANYRTAAASFAPSLGVLTSTNPFGSDHVSYINAGLPGILTIDADYDSYPHYHRTTDLPQYLVPGLAFDIIKTDLAVVAAAAGYPN